MIWLLKNWKWVAAGVLVAALLGERWYHGHTRYAEGRSDEKAIYDASISLAQGEARAKEEGDRAAADQLEAKLVEQSRDLTAADGRVRQLEVDLRRALRTEPERLCIDTSSSGRVPSTSASTSEPADTTGGRGPGGGAAPDLAGKLAAYAQRCEQDRLTVLGWQERATPRDSD